MPFEDFTFLIDNRIQGIFYILKKIKGDSQKSRQDIQILDLKHFCSSVLKSV